MRPVMRLLTLVALCALTSCDGGLTEGAEEVCPDVVVQLCTNPELVSRVIMAIGDAQARLIPSLSQGEVTTRLNSEVAKLARALAAGNVGDARAALEESDLAVENGLSAALRGNDPDLTSIALALMQVELLLK